jgi:hypothetical protein
MGGLARPQARVRLHGSRARGNENARGMWVGGRSPDVGGAGEDVGDDDLVALIGENDLLPPTRPMVTPARPEPEPSRDRASPEGSPWSR